jgi:hypothetical protein
MVWAVILTGSEWMVCPPRCELPAVATVFGGVNVRAGGMLGDYPALTEARPARFVMTVVRQHPTIDFANPNPPKFRPRLGRVVPRVDARFVTEPELEPEPEPELESVSASI